MRRNTELGAVRLRTVLGLVILGVAGYVGAKVSAPYFANSQLKDKMREEARFAQANERTTEQVRDNIYREVQRLDIPLRREDVQVENSPSGTRPGRPHDGEGCRDVGPPGKYYRAPVQTCALPI